MTWAGVEERPHMTFDGMDRRALLQRALLLVGAATLPGGTQALAAAAKAAKPTFTPAHFAVLTALADTIVPKTDTAGAVEVGVPKLVDGIIGNWATPEHKVLFGTALDKLDAYARAQKQQSFVALTPEDRLAVLTPYDVAALKTAPKPAADPLPGPATTVDPQVGRAKQQPKQTKVSELMKPRYTDPDYAKLKELIVVLYYCSETALTTELGYEHDPGAWEPSMPITPTTRPWGGNALI